MEQLLARSQVGAFEHREESPGPHNGGRRRTWTAEQKLDIVVQSFSGTQSNIEICRRYSISEPTLYKWRSLFLEGAKAYLEGRGKTSVRALLEENQRLKEMLGELSLRMRHVGGANGRPKRD